MDVVTDSGPNAEASKSPSTSPTAPPAVTPSPSTVPGTDPLLETHSAPSYRDQAARAPSPAALLQSDLSRDRTVFFDLSFRVTNTQGANQDLIAAGRKAAIATIGTLYQVNDTIVLRVYNPAQEADKTVKALDGKGGLRLLPKTQNKLAHYFDGFRVRGDAEYVMYTRIRLSFNGDDDAEENFIVSAKAMLADDKGYLYRKTLQVAETATVGFLLNSHDHLDLESWQKWFAVQIEALDRGRRADKNLPTRQPPLLIGLNRRPIWDGIRRKDRPKGYKSAHALHIEVRKGQEDDCRLLLRATLMSPAFQARSNLPLLFIKALGPTDSRKEKMQHAINNHRHALESMEHTHSVDFACLDKAMGRLKLPTPDSSKSLTMRRSLLAMRTTDDSPLFLTVEKDRTGAGIWFTYASKHQAEATNRIAGLPLYLRMTLDSPDALKWFTPTAVDRMVEMEWDADRSRVITAEEREMAAALDSYDSEAMNWVKFDLAVVLEDDAKRNAKLALLTRPDQGEDFDQASLVTTGTNTTTGAARRLLQHLTVTPPAAIVPDVSSTQDAHNAPTAAVHEPGALRDGGPGPGA